MLNGSSKSRETLKEFLRKRVESHPGISIQKLTGHLSQLPAEIRMKYGGNVDSIRRVLEQFPDIFVIRNHDQVHVTTSKSSSKTTGASSSAGGSDDETTTLTGAKGKVYRLFKTYGFISVQHPISTSVYFSLRSFENGQHSSLLSSGLQLGDGVVLDAEVGPNDCEAKFRASRVARIKGGNAATPSDSSSPAPQTTVFTPLVNRTGAIETLKDEFGFIKLEKEQECAFFHAAEIERYLGTAVPALPEVLAVGDKIRFDADLNKNTTARAKWVVTTIHNIQNVPPCHSGSETEGSEIAPGTIIKRDGLIQMVKPEFGFIKFGTNYRDRAFFHLNNVVMPPRDTIKSLPDVFAINDRVHFEAKPSQKPSEKVKWQATTVWLSEFGPKGDGLDSADESGNEVFLSDDESDIMDLIQERLAADTDDDTEDDILGASSRLPAASSNTIVDGLKQYLRPVSPDLLPLPKDPKTLFNDFHKDDSFSPVPQSVEPSIVIFRGATGLVMDVTDYGGTVEVQDQACSVGSLKVSFLAGVFYSDGVRCTKRLCEVLGSGDAVSLDFMVGSNGAHEEVRCDLVWQGTRPQGVIQMSPEDFCRLLQIKVPIRHGGPSYEDFQLELEEAGHCMSAHTSISNSINPHRRRSHHSPPSFPPTSSEASPSSPSGSIHGDRAIPNGICVGNSLATSALFSNDISENVLRRVARIMAEELHALQQQERLAKGSVRDVGTQTTERGVRSVP
uniref:Egal-1 winged helix domain-containing protein n=1 Tax=Rhipicephalus pulchellus TaxID=72859 RepID=L7LYM5_RHIPC